MQLQKYSTFFLILILKSAYSAKILAYFCIPSVSHQYIFQPIWRELSLRGHEVTVITPNPLRDPTLTNLTEVDASIAYQLFEKYDFSNVRRETMSIFSIIEVFHSSFRTALELQMSQKEVKNILESDSKYDLILVEAIVMPLYGLHHRFKAPIIGISSVGLSTYPNYLIGNPIHPILYPDTLSEVYGDLTIWEKFDSIYVLIATWIKCTFYVLPDGNQFSRSLFGEDMPPLEEIYKNSITFVNLNPIVSEKRPSVPNVMEFSNIHLERNDTLPKDLKNILDKAKNGVVYFSLGTNVRLDHVDTDIKQTILKALSDLPYKVLCKWESENFPGQPENVVLRKWFPQQAILAHPNVKSFVTQGGLQSSEEAISNGVPLVMIPFLGDQPMNAKILTKRGMAETILPSELNADILRDTILKVTGDEKYRLRAQELRSIFLDQPQTGLDKIIWWCEYVIRHKGAAHLRSPSADIPLYEYFMLDVLAFVVLVLFITYKISCFALGLTLKVFRRSGDMRKKKTS